MTTATINMKKLETKLAKAKTALILEHPFVGTIALSMPFEFDENIKTAATNGKRIKFNPEFVDSLTDEEVKFLVAHECFHPMLEHNFRRGQRQPRRWNMAADYVINKLLVDDGIGRMPKVGLHDPNIYNAGHGTSEGIYNILPEQDEGDSGFGEPGGPLDDCEDGDGSPAEQQQQQAEWKVKVAQAAQAAKMMGKMSANMQRLVDEARGAGDPDDRLCCRQCGAGLRLWGAASDPTHRGRGGSFGCSQRCGGVKRSLRHQGGLTWASKSISAILCRRSQVAGAAPQSPPPTS